MYSAWPFVNVENRSALGKYVTKLSRRNYGLLFLLSMYLYLEATNLVKNVY